MNPFEEVREERQFTTFWRQTKCEADDFFKEGRVRDENDKEIESF